VKVVAAGPQGTFTADARKEANPRRAHRQLISSMVKRCVCC
jgi:hypothetical protein